MRIHTKDLAEVADLISEANLQRVPTVVDVLDHLGHLKLSPDQRRIEHLVKGCDRLAAATVEFSNDSLWGRVEVANRRTLAQEFRIVAHAETNAGAHSRRLLQDWNHNFAHSSGQDGAADSHYVATLFALQSSTDLLADTPDVSQVEITIRLTRRS